MIPRPGNLRAVRGLEAEVARLTGDAALARRVRQATTAGRPIDTTLAKAIERAMVKRGVKSLEARNLLNWIKDTQNQTVVRVTDPATLAQPLLKSGVVGWARDPDRKIAVLVEKGTGCRVLDDQGKEIVQRLTALPSSTSTAFDRQAFLAHVRRPGFGEGEVSHFYLDDSGNVTIGIGHKVRDEAEVGRLASTYTFLDRATAQSLPSSAQSAAVLAAYRAVKGATSLIGSDASAFQPLTSIDLPEADYVSLLMMDVDGFVRILRGTKNFTLYSTYPPTAKLAILDMVFTLGVANTVKIFPKFTAATLNRDWEEASLESKRSSVNDKRNRQVFDWLQAAAKLESFFVAAPTRQPCQRDLTKLLSLPPP